MSNTTIYLLASIVLSCLLQQCAAQFYNSYTTNVYGRQPFKCYSCTNDNTLAGSRGQFSTSTPACGFGNDFWSSDPNVRTVDCYTFCQKKEVGISGSKVDVIRTCEPTCQEYNGASRGYFLIDKISCCRGNYCNSQVFLQANTLLSLTTICIVKLITYKFFS